MILKLLQLSKLNVLLLSNRNKYGEIANDICKRSISSTTSWSTYSNVKSNKRNVNNYNNNNNNNNNNSNNNVNQNKSNNRAVNNYNNNNNNNNNSNNNVNQNKSNNRAKWTNNKSKWTNNSIKSDNGSWNSKYSISSTDPIALSSLRYHPSVIRSYKLLREKINYSSSTSSLSVAKKGGDLNDELCRLYRVTEYMLIFMNKNMHKFNPNHQLSDYYWPRHIIDGRRWVSDILPSLAERVTKDHEILTLAVCLSILLPKSQGMWIEVDRKISKIIQEKNISVNTAMLMSHCFNKATIEFDIRSFEFTTPQEVVKFLINHQINNKKDLFEFNSGFDKDFHLNKKLDKEEDIFAPIGSTKAEPSYIVEQTGLMLQCLSIAKPPISNTDPVSGRFLCDVTDHCLRILSTSLTAPVKFASLRAIWETAPLVALPNSYTLYKALYDQVQYSLLAEPLQLTRQEEAISTLLESMNASKFKSQHLIQLIHDSLTTRGMDTHKSLAVISMRLFNTLIELDAIPFAMTILNELLEKSPQYRLSNSKKTWSLNISKEAKIHIEQRLASSSVSSFPTDNTTGYTSTDLILALYCFGREEHRTLFYKRLSAVEEEVAIKIPIMKLEEVLSLFRVYSLADRLNLKVIKSLDSVISLNINSLNNSQISYLLWGNARLNHRPAYIKEITEKILIYLKSLSVITSIGASGVCRTLWAMAVLQTLTLEDWISIEPIILKFTNMGDGKETHPFIIMQLYQIMAELRINAMLNVKDREINSSVACNNDELIEENIIIDSNSDDKTKLKWILAKRPWELSSNYNPSIVENSSWTHLDISKILNSIGVIHSNEEVLEYGYKVDILIPKGVFRNEIQKDKTMVIELNGPTHYDTYMQFPLGPTVMKHRHLTALGYTIKSLPYWDYSLDATERQKEKMLRELIGY